MRYTTTQQRMTYATIQGEQVPALGLGTWRLNGRACEEAVADALQIGYRHVDTAQAYENEAEVGKGMQRAGVDRDEIFLSTKVWMGDLYPDAVQRTTEESLRRLRTGYVDLLLIHWPNDEVPLEKTLDALFELQEQGKTRHVGVSNFTPSLLEQAVEHGPVFCNQVEYHPFLSQETLCALAQKHDLMLTAYSPLARGLVFKDETLQEIAAAHGKTPAQVALRWLIQQEKVTAIPKASSHAHRASNFDIFDFALSDEEMDRIFGLARGERIVDPDWAPWGG